MEKSDKLENKAVDLQTKLETKVKKKTKKGQTKEDSAKLPSGNPGFGA